MDQILQEGRDAIKAVETIIELSKAVPDPELRRSMIEGAKRMLVMQLAYYGAIQEELGGMKLDDYIEQVMSDLEKEMIPT
jgi:hypothetical protein